MATLNELLATIQTSEGKESFILQAAQKGIDVGEHLPVVVKRYVTEERHREAGDLLMKAVNVDSALEQYAQSKELTDDEAREDEPWYVEKAQLAEKHNRPDLAMKIYENFNCFEEAIAVAEKMEDTPRAKGLCFKALFYYEANKDYEQAAVFAEKAGYLQGAHKNLNLAIKKYKKEKNRSDGFRLMRKLWGIDKAIEKCEAQRWFEELGDWHQEQGNTEKAKQCYEKEVKAKIRRRLHKAAAGICLNKLKDPNRAEEIYMQSGHFQEAAVLQVYRGDIDAALVNYERAGRFLAAWLLAKDNRHEHSQKFCDLFQYVN